MAGTSSSSDDEIISGINVTPLVDVVLVLLVIFMITAPVIYQNAIKVELPAAKTGEQRRESPLNFTITQDGSFLLEDKPVEAAAIAAAVKQALARNPDETAVINADKATPHGRVVELMDALREAGMFRFALSVEGRQ